jgi:polysaccharide biosynthesis protein PslH
MQDLLYLVHRIPYPPNKGDKISSFNMLKYLSSRWRVHLGAFIDDPADAVHEAALRGYCADVKLVPLNPKLKKLLSLRGLLTGEALSLPFYRSAAMQAWVDQVLATAAPAACLMYSSQVAQFVFGKLPSACRSVMNAEDVDSEKWRAYALDKPWPLSWVYAREGRRLLAFERQMASYFDATAFISEDEAKVFQSLAPESAQKIRFRVQGVDSDYFDPAYVCDSPYPTHAKAMLFAGAMDYWPNEEAVTWFAHQVLPAIRAAVPDALFVIAGMKPTEGVCALAEQPGVVVTGAVPDMRPYVKHAHLVTLPLQIARGVQNKALEAMSMGKPIVATPEAMVGLKSVAGFAPHIVQTPADFAHACIAILQSPPVFDAAARESVLAHHNWEANLRRLHGWLGGIEG